MFHNINKILIIRPCAIGDFVQTLPAIRSLRNLFPCSYIEILGNLSTIVLAKKRLYADNISSFDRQDISSLFLAKSDFPESLINYLDDFDLVVSYLNDDNQVFAKNVRKIGIRNVITFDPLPTSNRPPGQSIPFHHSVNKTHIIDHLLKPIISLGADEHNLDRSSKIYVSEDDRTSACGFFSKTGMNKNYKVLAIHPGSGSKKKNWPAQKFSEAAKYLVNNYSVKLIIISGPADDTVIHNLSKKINMTSLSILKNMPLPSLAAILERVDCFIGNDSGISQIAAAVGTPSILIFGPTNPDIWAPRGENVKIIRAKIPCSPCQASTMKNWENQRCLEAVKVEDVLEQIQRLI